MTSLDLDKSELPNGTSPLAVRIIPCLDCKNGRVVKGVKFQDLTDSGDPVEQATLYEKQGADELVLLDVSATPEGRGHQLETVRKVRKNLSIPLTAGGGIRSEEDAKKLLEAGADRISINTAAVREPDLITRMANRFGRQCTVVAVDSVRHEEEKRWEVVISSGTEPTGMSVSEWVEEVEQRGGGEILLTSWDRDGTREGYDLDLLRSVAESTSIPIIASGGADHPDHMVEALEAGADAVLAASIFHFGEYTVKEIKDALSEQNIHVRPVTS